MASDFTANVRLFEDIHRLKEQRVFNPQVLNQLSNFRGAGESIKNRVEIVQRMPDLVNRTLLTLPQRAIGQKRIFLKEEPDLVPGGEEVFVGLTRLFVG